MKKENSNKIIKHNPLLNHPTLTIEDVHASGIPELNRQVIIVSQNYPKIRNISEKELTDKLIEMIGIIIWESGHNVTEQEQTALIQYMIEEIKSDFSNLTLEEVKFALKKGLRGFYGEVFGVNVKMMYEWLQAYVSETKAESLKYLQVIENKKPKELSEEIVNKRNEYWHFEWLKKCVSAFEEYKETGETNFIDIKNGLYDYIRFKIKLVDLTKEEVDNIRNHAEQEYRRERSPENSKNDIQMLDFISTVKKMESGDVTEIEKIKIIARRIALIKLFEKMKERNIDFRQEVIKFEKNK